MKIKLIDLLVMLSVLSFQAMILTLVEISSFSLTLRENYGAVLLIWFVIYGLLWVSAIICIIKKTTKQ